MSLQGDTSLLSLLSLLPGHSGSVGRAGAAAASFCPCSAPGCLERGSRASLGLEELLVPGGDGSAVHFTSYHTTHNLHTLATYENLPP